MARNGTVCHAGNSRIAARLRPANTAQAMSSAIGRSRHRPPRDGGINFAVASSVAEAAEVCLFDEAGHQTRFRLPDYDGGAWHGFVPGIGPGIGTPQAYGFRVRGP